LKNNYLIKINGFFLQLKGPGCSNSTEPIRLIFLSV
jgi:hypothetical protein